MTTLRKRMEEDLRVRNYSERTRKTYVEAVARFARHFGRSPDLLGPEEVRSYQVHLVHEKGASWTVLNQAVCALRFFFGTTLGKEWPVRHIPYAKTEKPLPAVLSPSETEALFARIGNVKHLAMLLTAYSAGLRVSEVAHLQVGDIDSSRMVIHVRRGKGRKDRIVPLSPVLLHVLREHWRTARPEQHLLSTAVRFRVIPAVGAWLWFLLREATTTSGSSGCSRNASWSRHRALPLATAASLGTVVSLVRQPHPGRSVQVSRKTAGITRILAAAYTSSPDNTSRDRSRRERSRWCAVMPLAAPGSASG